MFSAVASMIDLLLVFFWLVDCYPFLLLVVFLLVVLHLLSTGGRASRAVATLRVDGDDFASATANHQNTFEPFGEHFEELHVCVARTIENMG